MPDAFQNGPIGTLHDLARRPLSDLEQALTEWEADAPIVLVIPSLAEEIDGPALPAIVDTLVDVPYLSEIVIGLDGADRAGFDRARRFFSVLPQPHRILWNDGPRLRAIHDELTADGLAPASAGKGRNVWYCLGYVAATRTTGTVALHDADILTYDRALPARLVYPVAHPDFGYAFGKGYYHRARDGRLYGRVSRLLVTPLIRALQKTLGRSDYLDFLDAFRYPLAGEFAMDIDVVATIRIPSDWGLEIGVLSEIHRAYPAEAVCQVDVGGPYDHKHQSLGADADSGLQKMAADVAGAVLRKLATDGAVFDRRTMATIEASYLRTARRLIRHHANDAAFNGYRVDRRAEEQAVESFAAALARAGRRFLDEPGEPDFIPNWGRVTAAHPDVLGRLAAAVAADDGG